MKIFPVLSTLAAAAALGFVALPSFANTFAHTTVSDVRCLNNPIESRIIRGGRRSTTRRVICAPTDSVIANTQIFPDLPSITGPRLDSSLAALPNGTYRAVSPTSLISTSSFPYQQDRTLFTFQKLGNRIVGNIEYFDSTLVACVSGTIDGNAVVGDAITRFSNSFVVGQNALAPTASLQLGNFSAGNRYTDSVLDLNGFRFIQRGLATPPPACFYR